MAVAAVMKQFSFQASHLLPNHDGKCRNLHGHSYKVQVEAEGGISNQAGASDEGMVVDFALLSEVWREFLVGSLDHRHLNDTIGNQIGITTAENIALYILHRFRMYVPEVSAVTLWETETSYARVEWNGQPAPWHTS